MYIYKMASIFKGLLSLGRSFGKPLISGLGRVFKAGKSLLPKLFEGLSRGASIGEKIAEGAKIADVGLDIAKDIGIIKPEKAEQFRQTVRRTGSGAQDVSSVLRQVSQLRQQA